MAVRWATVGRVAARALRLLGYRASFKTVGGNLPPPFFDSRAKAQIGWFGWGTDYPAASAWFNPTVTCASFHRDSRTNYNPAELENPEAARRLWQRIDRQVVDQAPLVPLIVWSLVDVLSKRVGNYQYSGQGQGVLIDQLWVR